MHPSYLYFLVDGFQYIACNLNLLDESCIRHRGMCESTITMRELRSFLFVVMMCCVCFIHLGHLHKDTQEPGVSAGFENEGKTITLNVSVLSK